MRVDTHHHILPPAYVEALQSVGADRSGGAPLPDWSAAHALEVLDANSIDAAVLSISEPGIFFGDLAFTRDLARRCNDILAGLKAEHPSRFGALAVLPLPDLDAALGELDRTLGTLELDGVILLGNIGGRYLGHPGFDALFAELNRRGATVFIHPSTPPGAELADPQLPPFLVEFTFNTTRAAANLILSGTLQRCPDIRFVLAHAGGAAPDLAWRLEQTGKRLPAMQENAPEGAIAALQHFYYHTALSASPMALAALQALVPAQTSCSARIGPICRRTACARRSTALRPT
ncbi:MAG TPA: amidohydrolase family protein [Mesorhizobium sp.]|jgi:predicted TIM-barrel fold metal-dependent hydrolase|nr:amidohydrolase family protein [Mesorhizobium sp.]